MSEGKANIPITCRTSSSWLPSAWLKCFLACLKHRIDTLPDSLVPKSTKFTWLWKTSEKTYRSCSQYINSKSALCTFKGLGKNTSCKWECKNDKESVFLHWNFLETRIFLWWCEVLPHLELKQPWLSEEMSLLMQAQCMTLLWHTLTSETKAGWKSAVPNPLHIKSVQITAMFILKKWFFGGRGIGLKTISLSVQTTRNCRAM